MIAGHGTSECHGGCCEWTGDFAAAAVVTLAICLGGHAAMVAAVNRTLLHPLNVPEPDRVLLMANQYPRMAASRVGTVSAPPDYEDRRQHVTALEDQAITCR